jgi:alkanesulfonate monooxygenase SsuD/methylene tetrahydromethanopterin reductase-like flavin-dependent oxidoreductase (luciferase family)
MKYGFVIPGGDVDTLVEFGEELEAAGWDGVFVGDGVYGTDPWVSLAAIAMRTSRVRLGPLVTPLSRRRPWKLASEAATLDRLTGGRAILTVGMGATNTGFDEVGEATDRKTRAELLDEGLEIVTGLWSGKPFEVEGKHYHVKWDMDWAYTPVQQPRIPIWVVGAWPRVRSMERAVRYDGAIVAKMGEDGAFLEVTPEDVGQVRAFAEKNRGGVEGTFVIVVEGITPGDDREKALAITEPLAEAGATWWIESMWDVPGGLDTARVRARQGPPVK